MLACAFPAATIDWNAFPIAFSRAGDAADYDAIVVGAGLAGLSCAAAFARQGFRVLVVEQHDKPGGYATSFVRPGGFRFDVSLHSTTVSQRQGVYNLINGFPEISDLQFLSHPTLFRVIYPEHDITVAQREPESFIKHLCSLFPGETAGIRALFEDIEGMWTETARLSAAKGQSDMSRFAEEYPHVYAFHDKTWGHLVDARLENPKLKAIVSSQWPYYGLPPSKLSCFYYAIPFRGYLTHGGFYPKGRSQDISNALAGFIDKRGGKILLNTKVEKILMNGDSATGIAVAGGKEFKSRVVISNADPFQTFKQMVGDRALLAEYESRWGQYTVSLSSFQIFLGLKEDLVGKLGLTDSELFFEPSYDPETGYAHALAGDVDQGGYVATLYDNVFHGYSPVGKNTINIMTLQGYNLWEKFEKDYRAGNKKEYNREKERMANVLVRKAERAFLPGLAAAIEVKEIGTPLTNVRYTGHHRGAIYGWDQTVNNSGPTRIGHATPVKNLYLAGAWSNPGHGYGAVIPSGLDCFAEIVRTW